MVAIPAVHGARMGFRSCGDVWTGFAWEMEWIGSFLDVPEPGLARFRPRARMEADASGRITQIVDLPEARRGGDPIFLPGLVDAHAHLPQYPVVARREESLLPWLERHVFPTERCFTMAARGRDSLAREINAFYDELRAHGITCAVLFGAIWEDSVDLAFELAAHRGMRMTLGKMMMDEGSYGESQPVEARRRSVEETRRLAEKWHGANGGLLEYAVSPRFAVACSRELMREAGQIAREIGCVIQSHVSENHGEIARVRERFPEAADYVSVYHEAGLLGPRTLLGHGIHLSENEIDLLAATGTTIVHCPTSNFFLNSGICPLDRLRDAGVPLALASDVAGGPELNPFQVMRSAIEGQKARHFADASVPEWSPAEVFHLATAGAARVIGKPGLGRFDPDCEADVIEIAPDALLTPGSYEPEASGDDWLSLLIYRGGRGAVKRVWTRGRLV